MRRILFPTILFISLTLQACTSPLLIQSDVQSVQPSDMTPATVMEEPFSIANEVAGINAVHRGSWDEYSKTREFTDGYQATGQTWGDYDNDGWIDLFVTGGLAPNTLYHSITMRGTAPSQSPPSAKM